MLEQPKHGWEQVPNLYIYSPLTLPEALAGAYPGAAQMLAQALPGQGAQLDPVATSLTTALGTLGALLLSTSSKSLPTVG